MAYLREVAHYLPEKIVTNQDLIQFPEKYRNMIAEKAGIYERRYVTEECTSDIAQNAVNKLLEKVDVDKAEIDALICATSSPDRIQPATATRIQNLCGLQNAFAFDINSVCSSGIYALRLAASLVNDGLKNVVVVASEVYSKILNPMDITTFPYFGDGAGAALISDKGKYELVDFDLHTDGNGDDVIQIPAGGTMLPIEKVINNRDLYFTMKGKKVYDFACTRGSEVLLELFDKYKVSPDRVIPHQANINIIKKIAETTNVDYDNFFINLNKYANTAAASILIGLSESLEQHPQDKNIFIVTFGGGLSWGASYLRKI